MLFDSLLAELSGNFFYHPTIMYRRLNAPDNEPEEDLYNTPIGRLWQRFLKDTNLRICMNTLRPVGGCDGEATAYICYDIHIEAKTVHCYPVSQKEAEQIMAGVEVILNDSLNC